MNLSYLSRTVANRYPLPDIQDCHIAEAIQLGNDVGLDTLRGQIPRMAESESAEKLYLLQKSLVTEKQNVVCLFTKLN